MLIKQRLINQFTLFVLLYSIRALESMVHEDNIFAVVAVNTHSSFYMCYPNNYNCPAYERALHTFWAIGDGLADHHPMVIYNSK